MARPKKFFSEFGAQNIKQTSGFVHAHPLRQLQGSNGVKIFTEMYMIDPVVGAIMFGLENTIRQAEWRAELPPLNKVEDGIDGGAGEDDRLEGVAGGKLSRTEDEETGVVQYVEKAKLEGSEEDGASKSSESDPSSSASSLNLKHSPKAIAARKFIEECMGDMVDSWSSFISDAITFMPYGWSLCEISYKVRRGEVEGDSPSTYNNSSKYDDGRIGWKNFSFRAQESLNHWEFDKETGRVVGFWQDPPLDAATIKEFYIPFRVSGVSKVMLFKTKNAGGNPEGVSVLSNAYRPWLIRKHLEEVEGIGIERDLNGLPVLHPPEEWDWDDEENAAALAWAQTLIASLRVDEYMGVILPNGQWEVSLLSASGTRQHNTSEIINRYDKRIAMTSIAQFIMLGMERVGSFALVKSLSDMWLSAIEGHVLAMEEEINRTAVAALLKLNPEFSGLQPHEIPRIKASRINTPDLADFSTFLNVIAGQQIIDLSDPTIQNEILRIGRLPQLSKGGMPRYTMLPPMPKLPEMEGSEGDEEDGDGSGDGDGEGKDGSGSSSFNPPGKAKTSGSSNTKTSLTPTPRNKTSRNRRATE